jgi:hypothetical protein
MDMSDACFVTGQGLKNKTQKIKKPVLSPADKKA